MVALPSARLHATSNDNFVVFACSFYCEINELHARVVRMCHKCHKWQMWGESAKKKELCSKFSSSRFHVTITIASTAPLILLHCCSISTLLLLKCSSTAPTLLHHCCTTAPSLLLHCASTVALSLLHPAPLLLYISFPSVVIVASLKPCHICSKDNDNFTLSLTVKYVFAQF